jgi:hypothetical protein
MNAAGISIPAILIFPRKSLKPELMVGAPPVAISAYHP